MAELILEPGSETIASALIGAVAGGIAGGVAVLLFLLLPGKTCPDCKMPLPKVRIARTARQMFWGGWTCSRCGCEIDRRGRKIGGR